MIQNPECPSYRPGDYGILIAVGQHFAYERPRGHDEYLNSGVEGDEGREAD